MNLMGNYCKTSFLQNRGKAPISQTFFGTRLIPISPIFRSARSFFDRESVAPARRRATTKETFARGRTEVWEFILFLHCALR